MIRFLLLSNLDQAFSNLKHLLPGLAVGKLSFQEVLTVHHDVVRGQNRRYDTDTKLNASPTAATSYDKDRAKTSKTSEKIPKDHNFSETISSDVNPRLKSKNLTEKPRYQDVIDHDKLKAKTITHPQITSKSPWRATELEFKSLDIGRQGKLNYLSLKTALEYRDIQVPDDEIHRWIRENDKSGNYKS